MNQQAFYKMKLLSFLEELRIFESQQAIFDLFAETPELQELRSGLLIMDAMSPKILASTVFEYLEQGPREKLFAFLDAVAKKYPNRLEEFKKLKELIR